MHLLLFVLACTPKPDATATQATAAAMAADPVEAHEATDVQDTDVDTDAARDTDAGD